MSGVLLIALLQQGSYPPELVAAAAALDSGRIAQAIEVAERYTRYHPRDARGFLIVGRAYAKRLPSGRFRAIRAFREAERLDPLDPEPAYRIGMIGFAIGGADGERLAADGMARTLDRDPLYRDAWAIWLALFRNSSGREEMIDRLRPHAAHPEVRVRLARLLMEEERYAEADSLLAASLAVEPARVAWLALRAQVLLESGENERGLQLYGDALARAADDSTEELWRQVIGIASPTEVSEWATGIPPEGRTTWLRRFWARRNPNLFMDFNARIVEHFARLRHARREYPLLHPLIGFQRDAAARALQLEPSQAERAFHVRCEFTDQPRSPSLSGFGGVRPFYSQPPMPIQYRPMGGDLWWLSDAEREAVRGASAVGALPMLQDYLAPPVFLLLGLDLRAADSVAARVGYNLATGLSDRGLTYLRFGPPDRRHLGGRNSMNPECNTTELEYWEYENYGTLRFAKPSAFSEGLRSLPEVVFRPMETPQFAFTEKVLTEDQTSIPAPLSFGAWTAQFCRPHDPALTDLVVVSTVSTIVAALVRERIEQPKYGGDRGVVTLSAPPGAYPLLLHAHGDGGLGRMELGVRLRRFTGSAALSDLLLASTFDTESVDRRSILAHVRRDLTFAAGDTVRAYAELCPLPSTTPEAHYRATYSLLKTSNLQADYARSEWPEALQMEFERFATANDLRLVAETLDILPQWITRGSYLLRLEAHDLPSGAALGRATIGFEVR